MNMPTHEDPFISWMISQGYMYWGDNGKGGLQLYQKPITNFDSIKDQYARYLKSLKSKR